MVSILRDMQDEVLYHMPSSFRSNGFIALGVGVGALLCCRYYLSSRYVHCKNTETLHGKTCIITGATSGIGQAVAKELARRHANIIIACRDVQKGCKTALSIREAIPYSVNISVYYLDLSSMDSVRKFAFEINKNSIDVDILVNNAGIFCTSHTTSKDNHELDFAVNHLGHFLLTYLLIPRMKNKTDARIITVTSSLYKQFVSTDFVNFNDEKGFSPFMAYARSKLANILFTLELSKRLPKGITINCMHPGLVFTDLARYHFRGNVFLKYLYKLFGTLFLRSPDDGAQTIVHMATEPSLVGVTGEYFGDCRVEELKSNAKDTRVAENLFNLSEQLCDTDYKSIL